jgi:hypothetical protein
MAIAWVFGAPNLAGAPAERQPGEYANAVFDFEQQTILVHQLRRTIET